MASDHLSEADLARLAVSGAEDPHAATCGRCGDALTALEGVVARLRALPEPPERLVDAAVEFFRRRRALEALIERLTEDPALRAKARTKPEQVLRDAGLDPIPELVEALRETGRPSGDLARRIAAKHLWM